MNVSSCLGQTHFVIMDHVGWVLVVSKYFCLWLDLNIFPTQIYSQSDNICSRSSLGGGRIFDIKSGRQISNFDSHSLSLAND